MDQEFLKALEQEVSDVGMDEVWKKQVGQKLIWFSPVSTVGQGKVQEAMLAEGSGTNNIMEAKKLTLAYAIVGINELDFRPYRKAGSVFPIRDPRMDETTVDLPRYLLFKITDWGSEFIDVAFDMFADLMESHKKRLLDTVKFENAKDPRTELSELEDRAAIIREQLNLPRMAELSDEPKKVESSTPSIPDLSSVDFNPFELVKTPDVPPVQPPVVPVSNIPISVPQPPAASVAARAAQAAAIEGSLENPFKATPSVSQDVVETPKRGAAPVAPPVINPISKNVNPRFKPTR